MKFDHTNMLTQSCFKEANLTRALLNDIRKGTRSTPQTYHETKRTRKFNDSGKDQWKEEPRTRRQRTKMLDDLMTKLGIVNKHTVIRATEDGGEVERHDRQRLLPRHMMMMMFENNSEKVNITDEHVVTILSMSVSSASVYLAKVLSEVRSSPY